MPGRVNTSAATRPGHPNSRTQRSIPRDVQRQNAGDENVRAPRLEAPHRDVSRETGAVEDAGCSAAAPRSVPGLVGAAQSPGVCCSRRGRSRRLQLKDHKVAERTLPNPPALLSRQIGPPLVSDAVYVDHHRCCDGTGPWAIRAQVPNPLRAPGELPQLIWSTGFDRSSMWPSVQGTPPRVVTGTGQNPQLPRSAWVFHVKHDALRVGADPPDAPSPERAENTRSVVAKRKHNFVGRPVS